MPRSRWTERLGQLGLVVLYFAALTPVGWAARAVRDPLHRARDPDRASYLEPPPRGGPARRTAGRWR
ncbi:hypothetical protein [Streptomyces sp. NPDC015131]|uniref:hypothetical protein n=1 Tax=Streptomyces sp. NPDC015131 TaxID=3364941 RepID=UPI0036F86F07